VPQLEADKPIFSWQQMLHDDTTPKDGTADQNVVTSPTSGSTPRWADWL